MYLHAEAHVTKTYGGEVFHELLKGRALGRAKLPYKGNLRSKHTLGIQHKYITAQWYRRATMLEGHHQWHKRSQRQRSGKSFLLGWGWGEKKTQNPIPARSAQKPLLLHAADVNMETQVCCPD